MALHNGRVYVERLVKAPDPAQRPLEPNHGKTIVVTGGTKGLGLEYTKQVLALKSMYMSCFFLHSAASNLLGPVCLPLFQA